MKVNLFSIMLYDFLTKGLIKKKLYIYRSTCTVPRVYPTWEMIQQLQPAIYVMKHSMKRKVLRMDIIYIPVQQQIKSMLSNNKLFPYLTNRNLDHILKSKTINVTTSELYKELILRHGLNPNDVSLTWNTDGIPIFNSSNFSVWHLLMSAESWSWMVFFLAMRFGQEKYLHCCYLQILLLKLLFEM